MTLASWFQWEARVASVAGVDSYGTPTFGQPRSLWCRWQQLRRMARRANGEEVVVNHVLYTDAPVQLTDRVWLPGASTSNTEAARSPISVTASPDKTGSRTLYKVELG